MKKIIASSVLATAALLPNFTYAEETTYPASMTTDSAVEIRKGTTPDDQVVTTLPDGESVVVVDEFTNSSGELWYKVESDGISGWGLSTGFQEADASLVGQDAVSTGSNVNVRRGASTSYEVIGKLTLGQKVKVIDQHANSQGELWYRISFNGQLGWVIADFLKADSGSTEPPPSEPAIIKKTVQVDSAAVRRGASSDYQAVATLSKNQEVSIIAEYKNSKGELWYRVDLGSVIGWVISSAFVKPAYTITTKTVLVEKADVRRGASSDYESVATLSKNQGVKVIGEHKNSKGELWYRVDLGSNIVGWVINTAFIAPPYTVTTKVVQIEKTAVRRGASSDYESVSTLSKNQSVKVIGEHKNSKGELWYRVDIGSNIIGWVISSAFDKPQYSITTKVVQVESAAVRRGASSSYEAVAAVSRNQEIKIIDEFTNSSGELWYRADLGDVIGWVNSTAFEKPQPGTISLSGTYYVGNRNTNLYSGATYDYRVVERLNFTGKVTVLSGFINDSLQTWARVSTSTGNTGWVPLKDLVKSTSELDYVYALSSAALRRGASTSYGIAAALKADEPLLVLSKLSGWLNVETAAGIRGWILESQTSEVSLKRLASPSTYTEGNANYLVWKKPTNFDFTYSKLSDYRLKLTQGITDAELPNFKVKGIKTVETVQSTSTEKSVILTFEPGYTFTIRDYSDKVTIKVIPTGLLGKQIVIDAGHGGKDAGAIGPTGLMEKDVNLATALLLKSELERNGASVLLTRSRDIFLELAERTAIANSSTYDAFISIHADSFSSTSRGSTTFFNSTVNFNGPISEELADSVQKYMVSSLGTYNRGVKEQEFYVNRMNHLPSILVELAFISNPNEESLLRTTAFRQKAAEGIRKGFQDYYSSF